MHKAVKNNDTTENESIIQSLEYSNINYSNDKNQLIQGPVFLRPKAKRKVEKPRINIIDYGLLTIKDNYCYKCKSHLYNKLNDPNQRDNYKNNIEIDHKNNNEETICLNGCLNPFIDDLEFDKIEKLNSNKKKGLIHLNTINYINNYTISDIDIDNNEYKYKDNDIDKEIINNKEIDLMNYAWFLEILNNPISIDLKKYIFYFIEMIYTENKNNNINDTFKDKCKDFFNKINYLVDTHIYWGKYTEDIHIKIKNGIEKYVMEKIGFIGFSQLNECKIWKIKDNRFLKRMKILSFITPEMLEINQSTKNEVVWSISEEELRKINLYISPQDKINCIIKSCTIIFNVLNFYNYTFKEKKETGADDFLPIFIYIVLHSNIPNLITNCEYITFYRNENDLMSKGGYCLANLKSAIEFITILDSSMLNITKDEYDLLYNKNRETCKYDMEIMPEQGTIF